MGTLVTAYSHSPARTQRSLLNWTLIWLTTQKNIQTYGCKCEKADLKQAGRKLLETAETYRDPEKACRNLERVSRDLEQARRDLEQASRDLQRPAETWIRPGGETFRLAETCRDLEQACRDPEKVNRDLEQASREIERSEETTGEGQQRLLIWHILKNYRGFSRF